MRIPMLAALCLGLSAATACSSGPKSNLTRLTEARRLVADALTDLASAGEAGNRAVMADTDERASAALADADAAIRHLASDTDALGIELRALGFDVEQAELGEFEARFQEFRRLDERIAGLAVRNTNMKARRLAFGAARQAADRFSESVERLAGPGDTGDALRRQVVALRTVAAMRDIQALQAPHIAEPDVTEMDRLEARAQGDEQTVRSGVTWLKNQRPSREADFSKVEQAATEFLRLNAEIFDLSRQNSNVWALALSLGDRRIVARECERHLQAIRDALATRTLSGTR